MIRNLDRQEIDGFLRSQLVGRLGVQAEGQPYVVPLIYAWDGEAIYVQSIEGRKIDTMRANPRVAFEVDEYRRDAGWTSVVIEGSYEELDGEGAAHATALLLERFGGPRPARPEVEPETRPVGVAFRIRCRQVTGRSLTRANSKQCEAGRPAGQSQHSM